jgi:hypothetical protein
VGKKKREEKLKKKALKEWEERRPKTFREALKYFPGVFLRTTLVMMAAVALILFLGALGLKVAESFWFPAPGLPGLLSGLPALHHGASGAAPDQVRPVGHPSPKASSEAWIPLFGAPMLAQASMGWH